MKLNPNRFLFANRTVRLGRFIRRIIASAEICRLKKMKRGEMDVRTIRIPEIELRWSKWIPWVAFKLDARSNRLGVTPPSKPGVYEARLEDKRERLAIGKTRNLRIRIKEALVKSKDRLAEGKRLKSKEDTTRIVIRWATTDRPSAVEEELHKQHLIRFGALPKYTSII